MSIDRKAIFESMSDEFQSVYKHLLQYKQNQLTDVPYGQRAALFTIAVHKKIQVKQLASFLHITPGAATQHADALMQAELIVRTTDPEDRRAAHLTLSKKGHKCLQKLKKEKLARMHELFESVTDEELQDFVKTIQKIHANLREKGERSGGK